MLLAAQLRHIHYLDAEIDRLSQEIVLRQQPHEAALAPLQTIPGADIAQLRSSWRRPALT
jgi:transposase